VRVTTKQWRTRFTVKRGEGGATTCLDAGATLETSVTTHANHDLRSQVVGE
jgi:hypothetical protein